MVGQQDSIGSHAWRRQSLPLRHSVLPASASQREGLQCDGVCIAVRTHRMLHLLSHPSQLHEKEVIDRFVEGRRGARRSRLHGHLRGYQSLNEGQTAQLN